MKPVFFFFSFLKKKNIENRKHSYAHPSLHWSIGPPNVRVWLERPKGLAHSFAGLTINRGNLIYYTEI